LRLLIAANKNKLQVNKMEKDTLTGWEFHKRTHFDEIVVNYDKARPEYPDKLFKDVFEYAGAKKSMKALEIGAGTGKAALPFLNAGYDITAVEMGANMSEFLLEKFRVYKNFNVINSTFEDALLEDGIYDLIYAASAFHWVDQKIGFPKVLRLLKNNGTFALFRYNTIPSVGEELREEIQAVYEKYYSSYYTAKKRPDIKSREEFAQPSEILHNYGFENMGNYGFRDVQLKFYDKEMNFSADEYIALCDTLADHRGLPEENKSALYAGIKEAIEKHGGRHRENWVFQLYIGRK